MNNGRITLCPFYVSERDKGLTCEDTRRMFDTKAKKYAHMDKYCDLHWQDCEYAKNIQKAYEKGNIEQEKEKATRNELRSITMKLNKIEKRLEAKEEEIKKLRKQKDKWEQGYLRKSQALRDEEHNNEIMAKYLADLSLAYEARLAYLIDMYVPEKTVSEQEIENWIKSVEYVLEGTKDDNGHVVSWKTKVRKRGHENVLRNKTN